MRDADIYEGSCCREDQRDPPASFLCIVLSSLIPTGLYVGVSLYYGWLWGMV